MNFSLLLTIAAAITIQLSIAGNEIANKISLKNTLDFSWQIDIIERFLHGFIAGRDFIFTYGPLSQIMFSLPAILLNQKSYIAVIYFPIILSVINILLIYLISNKLVNNNKTSVIITAYLTFFVSLLFYDSNNLLRMLLPFYYGILAYSVLDFININKLKNIAVLSLPAIFGLYTYDIFIICVLITIFLYIYKAFTAVNKPKSKTFYLTNFFSGSMSIISILLIELIISFILSGNFNYIIYSYDTMKNYQYIENIPLSANINFIYLIYPAGLIIFLLFALKYSDINHKTKEILIILTFIAFLQLKSAFIRSDDSHIIMGIYPSLIILFIIFFILLRERFKMPILIIFFIFYVLIPVKTNYIHILNFNNLESSIELLFNNKPFFKIYKTPANYPYTQKDFALFEGLINKNKNKIMIYPYDNYILNIFGTTFNTLPLQYYQYSNSVVEKDNLKLLNQNPPDYIILGIDSKAAVMLDNIPNFSRNPLTAKWMLENYSIYKKTPKYLILQKGKKPNNMKKRNADCQIYDVDLSEIMKPGILESITKTSTIYLGNYETRLPYTADTKEVLIVKNHTYAEALTKLFNSNINFDKYKTQTKKLKIIKKHPIPIFKEEFDKNYNIKCY